MRHTRVPGQFQAIAVHPGSVVDLALAQQGRVRFDNVFAGGPRTLGELRIDRGTEVDAFEVFADICQLSVGAEILWVF
jgi:hypothetical protein